MKQQITFAVVALISSSAAIKTSEGITLFTMKDGEVKAVQVGEKAKENKKTNDKSESSSDSSSDSSDSDSDEDDKKADDKPKDKKNLMWQVTPDLGELDDHSTLLREWDNPDYLSAMKPKFSGWTNPLSWTDSGNDDDQVLVLMTSNGIVERRVPESSLIQWQVTPDLGELDDHSTLLREWDNPDYLSAMKPKFSGWTNPLSWTDSGNDDDQVLVLMTSDGIVERRVPDNNLLQYQYSEGPTKVDFGDSDMHVIGRERDTPDYLDKMEPKTHGWTNPLSWSDGGDDDEKVI